jgi:hypothetical protein
MGQLANVIINGLDTFSQKPISQPAFAASAIVICNLLPDWLGQNKKLPKQKRGFFSFFLPIIYCLAWWMCSVIPLCAESSRGAAVALVLRSKQKLLAVCYSHTQRKLYYPEKVKRHKRRKHESFKNESQKLLRLA